MFAKTRKNIENIGLSQGQKPLKNTFLLLQQSHLCNSILKHLFAINYRLFFHFREAFYLHVPFARVYFLSHRVYFGKTKNDRFKQPFKVLYDFFHSSKSGTLHLYDCKHSIISSSVNCLLFLLLYILNFMNHINSRSQNSHYHRYPLMQVCKFPKCAKIYIRQKNIHRYFFVQKKEPVTRVPFQWFYGILYEPIYSPFSRAKVTVVASQTSLGPKYWIAPG